MSVKTHTICFHCGEPCTTNDISINEKVFCCVGCKSVFSILNQHELDGYYCLNETPGNTFSDVNEKKFQFLDDESVASKIISFKNSKQTQVQFYLPQIHCSSCLWLLENVHKLNDGILSSQVNFNDKKVSISFYHEIISLRKLAELLTSIGYEPYITLQDYELKQAAPKERNKAMKLGLVGFCFANIMLISFPEYLGLSFEENPILSNFLRYTNLALSLPVLFYGAQEFFFNAWASLKQRYLNIDAPIVFAILVTFSRSVYEIVSHTGAGYLDSMSGIVFFMLIGRSLQHKTFSTLKFNRDYKSYFPISVTQLEKGVEKSLKIQDVKEQDVLKLHHQEIVPVDCMLSSKSAEIDYSFVTGENEVSLVKPGELIYAGGKIMNTSIEVLVVKPFSQTSFTSLWNNKVFKENQENETSFVDVISKYFSLGLFIIAGTGFGYWQLVNAANSWDALTAVLIVACPCTLLLASSYAYGFMIELFSHEGLFVKNSNTLQKMTEINHIVFDKTGTLTEANKQKVAVHGDLLPPNELQLVLSVMHHSSHPLSRGICAYYANVALLEVEHLKEIEGEGLEAWHNDQIIKIGKASFVGLNENDTIVGSTIYYNVEHGSKGCFEVSNSVKANIPSMLQSIQVEQISLLSGDNETANTQMFNLFPKSSVLKFRQSPQDKLNYVEQLQHDGSKVLMVGDGINDAGALKQSHVGISVVEDTFSFSPASDAILNGKRVADLGKFLLASKRVKKLIIGTFIYSLLYNAIGLSIAVSANLKPVVAAILMPASSISVIIIAFLGTKYIHRSLFKK